jgi:hypothetical protein
MATSWFSPAERAALQPGDRYSMAQMERATDIVVKRSAPLKALFQRACELGVLVGRPQLSSTSCETDARAG